jgi:outer membrane lipoprotein-sorting protein
MTHRTPAVCIVLAMLCFTACSVKTSVESEATQPTSPVAAKSTKAVAEQPAAPIATKTPATVASEPASGVKPFKDEPAARALYKQMVKAMRKADSLSYVSRYGMEGKDGYKSGCIYRAWLKKPNYFRVEVGGVDGDTGDAKSRPIEAGGGRGVLIGDGSLMWIYWPNGRYKHEWEDAKDFAKTRLTTYIKKSALPGGHSIGHEVCYLGAMSMPVIDPSTFHGYTDSLQEYVDGITGLGSEKVGDEDCDKIEVSIMKHQRSWYLCLSQRDHLPRKMREIVRVSFDLVITEDWSSVIVNGEIPDKMFVWRPPKDWTQYKEPPLEIGLLKPGTKAPDFNLVSADGTRIKLSDYRGKVVWFYTWRAG